MEPDYITLRSEQGDLAVENGTTLVLETNAVAIADKLRQAIRLRLGSSVYDLEAGFPWDRLLGVTNPIHYNTRIRNFLNRQPFITGVENLTVNLDMPTRTARIAFTVNTTLGESVPVVFDTLTGEL